MTQAQLDKMKEVAAGVVIQYSNGWVDAMLGGADGVEDIFDHCTRLHYLWGILDEARLVGTDIYVGDTEISGASIAGVFHKIWHYNGIFAGVDLSDYSSITADDGDGGAVGENGGDSQESDHYRAGSLTVVAGSGTVTFYKNGVASPLLSSNYQINAYVITTSGYLQENIVIGAKYKSGFTYTDILDGTLHYVAQLNT